ARAESLARIRMVSTAERSSPAPWPHSKGRLAIGRPRLRSRALRLRRVFVRALRSEGRGQEIRDGMRDGLDALAHGQRRDLGVAERVAAAAQSCGENGEQITARQAA